MQTVLSVLAGLGHGLWVPCNACGRRSTAEPAPALALPCMPANHALRQPMYYFVRDLSHLFRVLKLTVETATNQRVIGSGTLCCPLEQSLHYGSLLMSRMHGEQCSLLGTSWPDALCVDNSSPASFAPAEAFSMVTSPFT